MPKNKLINLSELKHQFNAFKKVSLGKNQVILYFVLTKIDLCVVILFSVSQFASWDICIYEEHKSSGLWYGNGTHNAWRSVSLSNIFADTVVKLLLSKALKC